MAALWDARRRAFRAAPRSRRAGPLAPISKGLRRAGRALAPGPRLRRRGAAVAVLALAAGSVYMLWLRDAPPVAVERVEVTGLSGPDAGEARIALEQAARSMTTLHVDRDALEQAAAPYPSVRSLAVQTDFPDGLRIQVIEHRSVAVLVSGEQRVALAADGSVLEGVSVEGSLPEIAAAAPVSTERLGPGEVLDATRVAGGAPEVLLGRLERIELDAELGLVASVEGGPELIFGTTDRLAAKWAGAVRVLADPDAAGADYLDVRIPERPAAGGLEVETVDPLAPAGEGAPEVVPAAPEPELSTP